MSKKKKKKKASKMVRTSKKPISLTCLINKKPIYQMVSLNRGNSYTPFAVFFKYPFSINSDTSFSFILII